MGGEVGRSREKGKREGRGDEEGIGCLCREGRGWAIGIPELWIGEDHADIVLLELSLTVPITNSLAFLFTVLGEWWAEGKIISRGGCFDILEKSKLSIGSSWCDRHMDWYDIRFGRHSALRPVEEYMIS